MTAAIGAVRWLIHVYLKQAGKIEELRSKNEKANITILKDSIGDLKKELDLHRRNLKSVEDKMTVYMKKIDSNHQDQAAVIESMQLFIESTIKRIKDLESKIIDLTNGLFMIKGKNGGTKGNT